MQDGLPLTADHISYSSRTLARVRWSSSCLPPPQSRQCFPVVVGRRCCSAVAPSGARSGLSTRRRPRRRRPLLPPPPLPAPPPERRPARRPSPPLERPPLPVAVTDPSVVCLPCRGLGQRRISRANPRCLRPRSTCPHRRCPPNRCPPPISAPRSLADSRRPSRAGPPPAPPRSTLCSGTLAVHTFAPSQLSLPPATAPARSMSRPSCKEYLGLSCLRLSWVVGRAPAGRRRQRRRRRRPGRP